MLYSSHSLRIADKFVYLKFNSPDDAVGSVHVPGEACKGDSKTPVLEWRKTAYSSQEIVAILLSTYEPSKCAYLNKSTFLTTCVGARSLQHKEDLKCDDMGAWKHNGSPKCWFHVENNSRGKKRITAVDKKSNPCDQLKTFMNLGELITRILQTRMFAKLSPNYTVCIPHLLD